MSLLWWLFLWTGSSGMIHCGDGVTTVQNFPSTLNIPCPTEKILKRREREAGRFVEAAAKFTGHSRRETTYGGKGKSSVSKNYSACSQHQGNLLWMLDLTLMGLYCEGVSIVLVNTTTCVSLKMRVARCAIIVTATTSMHLVHHRLLLLVVSLLRQALSRHLQQWMPATT